MTAERKRAIQHALQLMKKGLPWGDVPCHGSPATKCMIDNDSFDTNVLVHATVALTDDRVNRAQDLLARAMRATHTGQRRQKDDLSLARRPAGSVGR